MKNLIKKNMTLFDGDEQEMFSSSSDVKCHSCGNAMEMKFADCKSIMGLEKQQIDSLIPALRKIKSTNIGDTTFYKLDHLPICHSKLLCNECGNDYLIILGLGEYQPARYMAVLGGMFK